MKNEFEGCSVGIGTAVAARSERTWVGNAFARFFAWTYGFYAKYIRVDHVTAKDRRNAGEALHDQLAPMALVMVLTFMCCFLYAFVEGLLPVPFTRSGGSSPLFNILFGDSSFVIDAISQGFFAAGIADAVTALSVALECGRQARAVERCHADEGGIGGKVYSKLCSVRLAAIAMSLFLVAAGPYADILSFRVIILFVACVILVLLYVGCFVIAIGERLCCERTRSAATGRQKPSRPQIRPDGC